MVWGAAPPKTPRARVLHSPRLCLPRVAVSTVAPLTLTSVFVGWRRGTKVIQKMLDLEAKEQAEGPQNQ